jgi:phenylacetate-CoA ligase
MHLADDGLIVEVVKDGASAKPGEEGEIVVTELYGELMPLIRYRTGDRGVLSERSCSCGLPFGVLERLSGRVTELLRCPDGSLIDPDLFHPILKSRPDLYAAIRQWRVAQADASTVRITLCTRGAQPQPDVEALLVERFAALTGAKLGLAFTYEEWLEPKATGKTL